MRGRFQQSMSCGTAATILAYILNVTQAQSVLALMPSCSLQVNTPAAIYGPFAVVRVNVPPQEGLYYGLPTRPCKNATSFFFRGEKPMLLSSAGHLWAGALLPQGAQHCGLIQA